MIFELVDYQFSRDCPSFITKFFMVDFGNVLRVVKQDHVDHQTEFNDEEVMMNMMQGVSQERKTTSFFGMWEQQSYTKQV
jgi:hypothetical protein